MSLEDVLKKNMSREDEQLQLRRRVGSVVFEIKGSYALPTADKLDKTRHVSMMGTIVVAEPEFCYVVVRSNLIRAGATYQIQLPDGSRMDLAAADFSVPQDEEGLLAGFYVYHSKLSYDTSRVAAVEFGEDVLLFDEVHLCGMSNIKVNQLTVTGGHVINADDHYFIHDCAPGFFSGSGAPVFYEEGKLAGLCIQNHQGPSLALTVTEIKRNLMLIYKTKTLDEFYEKVRGN